MPAERPTIPDTWPGRILAASAAIIVAGGLAWFGTTVIGLDRLVTRHTENIVRLDADVKRLDGDVDRELQEIRGRLRELEFLAATSSALQGEPRPRRRSSQ